jgi:circadian clock protein KaiC
LVAGPSGAGKTVLATHFIAEGARRGEAGVLAVFEEHPDDYLARADGMGFGLSAMRDSGALKVVYLRRLDLSAEEILYRIQEAVSEIDAKRLVIDSLNGVELALAPTFRDDFREALYRLVGRLTGGGVSVLMTVEVMESFNEIRFSPHAISFLSQNILYIRYVEVESRLRKVLAVVKMRRSKHSSELRELEVTERGARILDSFTELEGMLTGVPRPRTPIEGRGNLGLSANERQVLAALQAGERLSEQELVTNTGLQPGELTVVLGRLLSLNYALREDGPTGTLYRALERPAGR